MKIRRGFALLVLVFFASGFFSQAHAASEATMTALEQCASQLSQCTGWKFYKYEHTERYLSYRLNHPDETPDTVVTHVNIGLDQPFYSNPAEIKDPDSTDVLVNKYRPLPPGFIPANLEKISSIYSYGTQKLTRDARRAFEKLCAAAKRSGYPIWAVSSYRDYRKQAEIYDSLLDPNDPNSAVKRELVAARPGYSEHQTGLAVDFSRVNASVSTADIHKWMAINAHKYGFIVRYPAGKEAVTGVTSEPWHLRYLGVTLATAVYNSGRTYDEYYAREIDIKDKGAAATAIGVTSASQIAVDGTSLQLSAYRILDDFYYKLRDIAVLLDGTPARFDLTWDNDAKRIDILQGIPYSSAPVFGTYEAGRAQIVTAATPGVRSAGISYDLDAYVIGGSNYYRLEDILDVLGLTAADDGAGTLVIDTAGPHAGV